MGCSYPFRNLHLLDKWLIYPNTLVLVIGEVCLIPFIDNDSDSISECVPNSSKLSEIGTQNHDVPFLRITSLTNGGSIPTNKGRKGSNAIPQKEKYQVSNHFHLFGD